MGPKTDEELIRTIIETRAPAGTGRMLAEALLGELARAVAATNVHQVQLNLASPDDLPEALEIARLAFENAG